MSMSLYEISRTMSQHFNTRSDARNSCGKDQKVIKAKPLQALRGTHYGLKYTGGWKVVTK